MLNLFVYFFKKLLEIRSFSDLINLIVQIFTPIVTHYGCPNSKRTNKLFLQKTLHR